MNTEETKFRKQLTSLLNEFSRENGSDTPDFVLADYLFDSLLAFDKAVSRRTEWSAPVAEYESVLMEKKTIVVEVGDIPSKPPIDP